MKSFTLNIRIALLLFGFTLFYTQAADKDALGKNPNVKTAQPVGKIEPTTKSVSIGEFIPKIENTFEKGPVFIDQESIPFSYEPYEQLANGIKFAKENQRGTAQKNNTHVKIGIVSTKSTFNEDVNENLIKTILDKYSNGLLLNAAEIEILRANINKLPVKTAGDRRPSISGHGRLTRDATDLFFSEYAEGSSNNKYLEIYNGTGANVDLSSYLIMQNSNGGPWNENVDTLSGTLANGDVYVIANSSADASILAEADLTGSGICYFNGDDARALIKVVSGDTIILDYIGSFPEDPGSGWDVAGVTDATGEHTLVRKSFVTSGSTNWTIAAGTNATDSEWIVHDQNTWSYLGSHTMIEPNLLSEGFENGGIPENWSVINNDGHPNSWYVYGSSLYAHTGNYSARVFYNPNGSNDWLITPKLDVVSGDSIVFWSKSDIGGIYAEDFNVRVSLTNADSTASFTDTVAAVTSTPTSWTRYAYSLDSYVDQTIFVAIQHVTVNGFYLYVDDINGPQIWIDDSPVAAFSKTAINFGNTGTGGISTNFVVSNFGASDLVISSIAVDNTDFLLSASSATLIGGGEDTETIIVTYTPSAVAGDSTYIIITHNGSSSPDSIYVDGAGKDAIYWQDFESWEAEFYTAEPYPIGTTQEGNMSFSGDGAANGWEKTVSLSYDFTGVNGALFDGDEGGYAGTDTSAFILPAIEYTTPSIYTDPAAVEGALRFYMKKRGTEEFYVAYSSDDGVTWTKAYSDTTENYGSGFYGWIYVSVEVPVGGTYLFKFVGRSNGQSVFSDVFVDEISFVEVPPTPELFLTHSTIVFMPQVIGYSTTSTAFSVGLNSGSATLVVDSVVTDNEDFSATLTTLSTGSSVVPGGNVDLDLVWSPTSFGLTKTNAVVFHNADTSPDTIVLLGEAGRSYVSFDDNDNFQGAAFDGDLPWLWVNEDADGDGDSWLFNYSYYGPGYTGDPVGYYARSPGGENILQTRILLPVAGDSIIFYYNSSNSVDSGYINIQVKELGPNDQYIHLDSVRFSGYSNLRAAIDLSAYIGDSIIVKVEDDATYNDNNYHRMDDLLLPAYEASSSAMLVFGEDEIDFGSIHPTTSASITIVMANMGTADLTISSVVSDNAAFSAVLANSTVLAETATELTATFAPMDGGVQSGNIVVIHDAPSSPDTLVVFSGGMAYITGVVTNNESGEALDSVTVDAGGDITHTNDVGEYGYYSNPTGLTLVQFMKDGYNNATFNTTLSGGDTVTLNAALEPLSINAMYLSGFESGEDQGISNAIVGTNNYAVADTHITASGDTVLPASGVAMLVFPDSGGYANNDYVWWVADSAFDITSSTGGLYFDLDMNIDTEGDYDFFYFCLMLDDGTAWYDSDNGFVSGSTDGWAQHRIDMSWALGMGSETARPVIIFDADGSVTGSGGVFDNISVTWNPFFLAPPGRLSVVNYGSSVPLSWEEPVGSGRASYNVGNIDLNISEPPSRPTVVDDNGNTIEQIKGPRDYPIITVDHDYSVSSTRSLLGYNIYRVVWPFGEPQLLTYVTGGTTYDDAAVSEGSYYEYLVRAVYDEGESGISGPVSVRTGLPVVVTDDAYGGEDFEASEFGWENWEAFYSSDAGVWLVGDSAAADSAFGLGGRPAPNHSNFAYLSDGRGGDADFETFLLSPFIDFLDNFTAIVKLSGYAQVWGDFAENNIVRLLVRSDMGPWQIAVDFGYDHMNGWGDYSASIGNLVSSRDKAQLALHYTHTGGLNSGYGNGVAFDDLVFETIPGPHNLTATPSTTDITLNWSHPDSSRFRALPEPITISQNRAAVLSDLTEETYVNRTDCFSHGMTNSNWITAFWGPDSGSLEPPTFATLHAFNAGPMELEETIIHGYYDTDDTTTARALVFVGVADSNGVTVDTIATEEADFNISNVGSWTTATIDLSGLTYNSTDSTFLKVTWTPLNDGYSALFDANIWIPGQRIDDPNVVPANGLSGWDSAGVYFSSADYNYVIEVCGTPTPPDISYNVYKDYNLLAGNLEVTTLVDNNVSVITESCYWVHGIVPRSFNIGITTLNVIHETDPSNTACASLMNSPPGNFSLTTPPDEHVVVVRPENIDQSQLFAWTVSVDPNGQPVNYTISLNATISGSVVTIEQDTSARVVMIPYNDVYNILSDYDIQDTVSFHWTVSASDGQNSTTASNGPRTIVFDIGYMLSNASEVLLPDVFALHQNYPNPFNPITTIQYDIPEESHVRIDIYNVLGQKVAKLVDTFHQPGFHTVNWDGTNMLGSALSSGMYFYRIQANNFTAVKKLLLVK